MARSPDGAHAVNRAQKSAAQATIPGRLGADKPKPVYKPSEPKTGGQGRCAQREI